MIEIVDLRNKQPEKPKKDLKPQHFKNDKMGNSLFCYADDKSCFDTYSGSFEPNDSKAGCIYVCRENVKEIIIEKGNVEGNIVLRFVRKQED